MAAPVWQVQGQYYENCNCAFVCPCVPGQMTVSPTNGSCTFVMAFQIEHGRHGDIALDGLGFVIVGVTPEEMAKGNWSVGVIVDERASTEQRDAIAGIASGAAGGPMAALGGLVGKFLGVESAPIEFKRNGASWTVTASDKLSLAGRGATGLNPDAAPMQLSNTGHPASDTFTLARASDSHLAALGVVWDDSSGRNNAQYAPFAWQSA